MRLRASLFLLLILAAVGVLFLNTWQGYRYRALEQTVESLESEQKSWLEKNKKAIAALAVLSSPSRIAALAVDKLGLRPVDAQEVIEIRIQGGRSD